MMTVMENHQKIVKKELLLHQAHKKKYSSETGEYLKYMK